jgi:hypothetical protein
LESDVVLINISGFRSLGGGRAIQEAEIYREAL